MAKTRIFAFNGSVVLPTGFNMDSQTMRVHEMQTTENITWFGGTTYAQFYGSGTTVQDVNITGFPFKGTTASNPGFGNMNGSVGAQGGTATITADTGCSWAGIYIVDDINFDESRISPGMRASIGMKPGGDITPSWATT